ncbi:M23 family metallopeptidase [Sphingobacterium bovistauri]|nr:M23 family metallopeptidase [Sphingobacterium bovistauri]
MFTFLFLVYSSLLRAQVKQIKIYPALDLKFKQLAVEPITNLEESNSLETELVVQMPLMDARVTSAFGWRRHPVTGKSDFHQGVDLAGNDKIVRNIMEGNVIDSGYHKNLGNYVRIDHGNFRSVYGHLSAITVKVHQQISPGYPIGITGSSGRVTGEHLHFGIMYDGLYINPMEFLQKLINTSLK